MKREHLVLLALFAVFALWNVALLLSYDPPFIDYPQHVWNLAVLRNPEIWADRFKVRMDPLGSNVPWFYFDRLLAPVLTPGQSMGLGFALAIIGLPLTTGLWARELGRDGWLAAALCTWVAWSGMIYWGFLHYCLAVVLGVGLLALDRRHQREGGVGIAVGLAVGWTFLYSLHTIAWFWCVLLIPLQRLVFYVYGKEPLRWDRLGQAIAAGVPSGLLALRWAYNTVMRPGELGTLGTVDDGLGLKFASVLHTTNSFVAEINASIRWTFADDVVGGLFLILGVVGAVWSLWKRPDQRTPVLAALAVGLFTVLGVYTLPSQMKGQYFIAIRLVAFVAPAAAVLAAPKLPERPRRIALALAVLVGLAVQGLQHKTVLKWTAEIAVPKRLMDMLPEGRTITIWADNERSAVVMGQLYSHLTALYAARHKGENAFSFAVFEPNPVIYREPDHNDRVRPGEEFRQYCAAIRGGVDHVDTVLVRGLKASFHCGAPLLYQDHLHEIGREGRWRLFEVTEPLPPMDVRCNCKTKQ